MILTFDTSTCTGWAAGRPGETPRWGSRYFRADNNGELGAMFRHWVNARIFDVKPDLIVFESPYIPRPRKGPPKPGARVIMMNATTLRRLLGLVFMVEAAAAEHRIECREATALEISQFFLGGGGRILPREEKKAATIEMCARYGWHGLDDNAADALSLWAMAEAQVAPALAAARGVGPLFIKKPAVASVVDIGDKSGRVLL